MTTDLHIDLTIPEGIVTSEIIHETLNPGPPNKLEHPLDLARGLFGDLREVFPARVELLEPGREHQLPFAYDHGYMSGELDVTRSEDTKLVTWDLYSADCLKIGRQLAPVVREQLLRLLEAQPERIICCGIHPETVIWPEAYDQQEDGDVLVDKLEWTICFFSRQRRVGEPPRIRPTSGRVSAAAPLLANRHLIPFMSLPAAA